MVLNLEQLSNENLVNFYKKELKMIGLGKPASNFFSTNARRRLLKKGILKRSAREKWITTITDMTRTLIDQTEEPIKGYERD